MVESLPVQQETTTIGYIMYTGHMYYGSYMAPYEGTDNCGTCDGAKCDFCKTIYKVVDLYEPDNILYYGQDKQKAIEVAQYDFTK